MCFCTSYTKRTLGELEMSRQRPMALVPRTVTVYVPVTVVSHDSFHIYTYKGGSGSCFDPFGNPKYISQQAVARW